MNVWRWIRLVLRMVFRIVVRLAKHWDIWLPIGLSALIGLMVGKFMVSTSHVPGWTVPMTTVLAVGILTPKIRKALDNVLRPEDSQGGNQR